MRLVMLCRLTESGEGVCGIHTRVISCDASASEKVREREREGGKEKGRRREVEREGERKGEREGERERAGGREREQ